MVQQIYFEDVTVGMGLPPLVKNTTTRQLVQWAEGSRDFMELHYDKDDALARGFNSVIVHGKLKGAFLTQLVTDWIGPSGRVHKFNVRYRDYDYLGSLSCTGTVTAKYCRDGQCFVECDTKMEDASGKTSTTATFLVTLPSRGQK